MSSRVSLQVPKQASPLKVIATSGAWADEGFDDDTVSGDSGFKALSAEEAQRLRERDPPVSPWRVIATQAALGGLMALLAGWWTGQSAAAWSALYGMAVAVIPGALVARGLARQQGQRSPTTLLVSFLSWEAVKMSASMAMLLLAPKLVTDLHWPALLVTVVLCIKVYWVALSWRGRRNG
jgi:ATP synthase protein I